MKLKLLPAILALCTAGLVIFAYLLCHAGAGITAIAGTAAAVTLVSVFALSFNGRERESIIFRIICGMLFLVTLVMNIVFAYTGTPLPWVAFANTAVLVVWLLTAYAAMNKKS